MTKTTTRTPFPLGRRVEHDERSRGFPALANPTVRDKSWRHWGPILDQGRLGSCTGNAAAQALNCVPLRHSRPLNDEDDAVRFYSRATQLDQWDGTYPPTDTGSSGLAVAKAVAEEGLISRYEHAFGLDHLLGALMLSPVLIGIEWDNEMFHPNADGFVHLSGGVAGGHEIVVHKVDVVHKWVCCLNSWSDAWGLHGHFRMGFNILADRLARDGDCTVLVRA